MRIVVGCCEESRLFRVRGVVDSGDDALTCSECSRKYAIGRNLVEFDDRRLKILYGRQFGEQAQVYEQTHLLDADFGVAVALAFRRVLERYVALPIHCALEVGCGTGVLTRGLNHHGIAQYFLAIDISKEMLDVAARKETADNVAYFVQDVNKLNIRSDSFDVVVGGSILHHLTYVEKGLKEVFRVLSHKGVAVFMEPFYHGNQMIVFLAKTVVEYLELQRKHTRRSLRALKRAIASYADDLQFRYEHRDFPEELAMRDDKHLFTEKGLKSLAQRVGFRNLEVVSLWQLNPQGESKVWKEITVEVIETLRKAAGLNRLRIDYSKVLPLEILDDVIGNELLEFVYPQGVIVFQK